MTRTELLHQMAVEREAMLQAIAPAHRQMLEDGQFSDWDRDDAKHAQLYGWDLFDADGILDIQRVDEANKFPSDDAARRWVLAGAKNNMHAPLQLLCLKAIWEHGRLANKGYTECPW